MNISTALTAKQLMAKLAVLVLLGAASQDEYVRAA